MRTIRSKQKWSSALGIVLLLIGLQISLCAQQMYKLSPKVLEEVSRSPLQVKEDDDPLTKLKKERFNAALNEAKSRFDLYNQGLTRVPDLIEVGERLFSAEADLYDKPEEKVQVLQRQLDIYSDAVTNLEKLVKQGLATQADLERLRYNQASVAINLFKVKNGTDKQ